MAQTAGTHSIHILSFVIFAIIIFSFCKLLNKGIILLELTCRNTPSRQSHECYFILSSRCKMWCWKLVFIIFTEIWYFSIFESGGKNVLVKTTWLGHAGIKNTYYFSISDAFCWNDCCGLVYVFIFKKQELMTPLEPVIPWEHMHLTNTLIWVTTILPSSTN